MQDCRIGLSLNFHQSIQLVRCDAGQVTHCMKQAQQQHPIGQTTVCYSHLEKSSLYDMAKHRFYGLHFLIRFFFKKGASIINEM